MLPLGKHEITLYHKNGSGIERHHLIGSWRDSTARTIYDGIAKIKTGNACVCRYERGVKASEGDLFVLGRVTDAAANDAALVRIHEKYKPSGAFICESVADNTLAGVLPHYCARGD